MDTIPTQQIPVQQPTVIPSPVQEPPQKKINIRIFFNITSWIILFALLPITVLIFLSQDSIPGDLFYPVKRSLENVILAAASVSPATRAAFRTDLTEARFKEAQSLVLSKSNTSGLSTFIDEVQGTKQEVTNLTSDVERKKAEEKLISKIEEYQSGLSTLQAKTEQNVITYQFQETLSTPIPPTTVSNQNQTPQNFPSPTPTLTSIPTPILTPTPTPTPLSLPSSIQSSPTVTPLPTTVPSLTLAPTITASVEETGSVRVLEQQRIAENIKEIRQELNKIRKDLEEKRERRNEEKEKRERKNESEKKDKDDGERKENSDQNK